MAGLLLISELDMQPSPTLQERQRISLTAFLLFVAIIAAYGGVVRCDFIHFDDTTHILQNPVVRGGLTWSGVGKALCEAQTAVWVPLTTISFMADVSTFGLDPELMHLENAVWHAAGAVLLFLALRRLTGRLWPSAIVAALFGLHPVNVESVAWVTERKNVLCGFFFMLALYAWSWWARERRAAGWWGALAAFAASLLAKPMAVTLPCVLLLLDFWPLQRFQKLRWWSLLLEKIPFVALSAGASYMAMWAGRGSNFVISYALLPLASRVTNALCSYGAYAADLVWPRHLTVFYAHPRVAQWGLALAILTGLLGLLGLALWQWRRRPYLLVGLLLFLGMLFPNLGFVQIGEQARADRFVYFAEIGLFIAAVWWLDSILPSARTMRLALASLPLGAFGVLTALQVEHWKNDLSLFQHTMAVAPMDNAMLALWLSALNNPDTARQAIQSLTETPPPFGYQAGHWDLMGRWHLALHEPQLAERDFRNALALSPADKALHVNLATALATLGENASAEAEFRQALAGGPGSYTAHYNYAILLEELGRKQEAREQYEQAFRLSLTDEGVALAMRKLDERLKP